MDNQVTLLITGGEIQPIITLPSSSTVRQLKRKIKEKIGVPCRQQRLLYDNIRLTDNTLINDYIDGAMAEVYLSIDLNGYDRMICVVISGQNFTVEMILSKVNRVIEVKQKIGEVFALDPQKMDLWHLGRRMEDNKMLYKYYVDDDSELKCTRAGYNS